MKQIAKAFTLLTALGCKANCLQNSSKGDGFDNIEPSTNLTWTPCLGGFTCAKLEVPLDYSNTSLGTTSIAFLKLAGKNATVESQNIVIIPGGPGGSGVDLLALYRDRLGPALGEQYNFVSFDPRGVNNSGPKLDCFSGNTEARSAFNLLHRTGITNVSASSLQEQYYSSMIYGEWCNAAVEKDSPFGYYVTTPAVAHDLLTFVEAAAEAAGQDPSDAKLWAYGASYGTAVGTTFASMFPDRIGRMVLDGVINVEQYYHNDWRDSVDQMDAGIESFASFCHSAGAEACSFWGPSAAEIMGRLDAIISQLQNQPIPVSGVENGGLPTLVTYSDLKQLFINSLYIPIASFPLMADVLHQLENGNASALAGTYYAFATGLLDDAGTLIRCADSYRTNRLSSIEEWESFVEESVSRSKYVGDIWPIFVETILCTAIRPELPDSLVIPDPNVRLNRTTSFPILFASNTIDPLSPLISAQMMHSRFPGSALLLQEAVGHTVVENGGSNCYFGHVQAYLQGVVPASNTTCPQQYIPFIGSA
ncbi:Alpha/Beta hydrolase protein [Xylaria bambusicola]|uniref:Alpha/Beta hydrolase protein n=1 Tax=Xylaria bambusicola TaxID=326684 RepID=UPI0020089EEE|nr:Alpha/Beta hydrolase protein [Xylaria bambusicola]KAI0505183.1 Alpha/Beta hydrolase protein [Xylaria bambusicola]